jgi:hypothetical protein
MTNASTLTRWVPRSIVGAACLRTLFVLPASPDPDPLVGIVDDDVDRNVDRAAPFWFLALVAARRDDRAAVALPTP